MVNFTSCIFSTTPFVSGAVEVGRQEPSEAVCSGILPPAAGQAASPEPDSVNHFKEESFSGYKIIFFLQKLKLHLVPPSPNTVTEISSQKRHVLKKPL